MIRTSLALALALAPPALVLAPSTGRADIAPPRPKKEEKKAETKVSDAKAPPALAAPAATTPQVRTPPAELDRMKFLVGNFSCDGTSPVKGSVDHDYKGKWTSKPVLGGFFVGWQFAETKAKDHPNPLTAEGHVSWDGGLKRYLFSWADSNGTATLLRAESPGDIDQYVFKGTATASFGRHVPHQFTLTRTPKGFDLLLEGADQDGQLGKLAMISCSGGGKGK